MWNQLYDLAYFACVVPKIDRKVDRKVDFLAYEPQDRFWSFHDPPKSFQEASKTLSRRSIAKSVARKKSWNHGKREPSQGYLSLAKHVGLLTDAAVNCPPAFVAWKTL